MNEVQVKQGLSRVKRVGFGIGRRHGATIVQFVVHLSHDNLHS